MHFHTANTSIIKPKNPLAKNKMQNWEKLLNLIQPEVLLTWGETVPIICVKGWKLPDISIRCPKFQSFWMQEEPAFFVLAFSIPKRRMQLG